MGKVVKLKAIAKKADVVVKTTKATAPWNWLLDPNGQCFTGFRDNCDGTTQVIIKTHRDTHFNAPVRVETARDMWRTFRKAGWTREG